MAIKENLKRKSDETEPMPVAKVTRIDNENIFGLNDADFADDFDVVDNAISTPHDNNVPNNSGVGQNNVGLAPVASSAIGEQRRVLTDFFKSGEGNRFSKPQVEEPTRGSVKILTQVFEDVATIQVRDINGDIVLCDATQCGQHRNADIHHENVLCPYCGSKSGFNCLPVRTMRGLVSHLMKRHSETYDKQTAPKPHILLRFNNRNELFVQCGCCIGFYNVGLKRHKKDELKAKKKEKWEDLNATLFYIRNRSKKPVKKLDPQSLWEDIFGKGSFEQLKSKVAECPKISPEVRENIEWCSEYNEVFGNIRKYYLLRSEKLLSLYIGSTIQLCSIRNAKHVHTCDAACDILKASDAEMTILGNLSGLNVDLEETGLKEQIEYFIFNTYEGKSKYSFTNEDTNPDII